MKFRIVKTDLFINNKLYPEGSEIELTKEQSKGIEEFLQPCNSEPNEVSPEQREGSVFEGHPEPVEGSQLKINKQKTKGTKK